MREAGDCIVSLQAQLARPSSSEHRSKPDGSLVSRADHESEEILLSAVAKVSPNAKLISEEASDAGLILGDAAHDLWLIDPLDGTKSYLFGKDDFAILVNRQVNNTSVFSMVYYPARGSFLIAVGDNIENQTAEDSPKLSFVSSKGKESPLIDFVHCSPRSPTLAKSVDTMESTEALYDLSNAHSGIVVIQICGHKGWDMAAPLHLVLASGGTITDLKGNQIDFNSEDFDYDHVIATKGEDHFRVVEILRGEL